MPRQNTIQLRKGAVSQWTANNNQVLASGEPAFETDTLRLKIGDGSTAWSGLNYIGSKETLSLVRNDTGDLISAGQALYVSGIYNNSTPSVATYVADGSISENLFIGLASSNISNNSNGYATSFGQIDNLNTLGNTLNALSVFGGTAWTNGTLLYAHPTAAGKLTSTPPTRAILVGTVIYAHGTQGKISVKLKSQGVINDLYDVNTSSALANQYLLYDGSSWIPTSGGIFDSVGIGITAPSGRLHVVSTGIGAIIGSYNEWTNGGKLRVYADDNDSQTQSIKSFISRTGVGLNIAVNATSYNIGVSGSGTNIGLYGYAANGSGNYGLYVDFGYGYFNSRVGIGTISPTADLHVNGSGLFSNNIVINGNSPVVENRFGRMTPIGNISLDNGNTNFITFRSAGTGLCPTDSLTFNSGLKILLRPVTIQQATDQPPIAIGLSNNSLWNVVSNTGWNYEWNAGTNNLATLSGNGMLSVSSGISSPVGNFTSGLNTNGLNSFKDITILGKNSIPTWNQTAFYNKGDMVKFENQYYTSLIDITTECPMGSVPENWFCCSDSIYSAPTAMDCPESNGVYSSSFSPTGYKPGWAALGSGDLVSQNAYSYNLYNHNNITSSSITANDLLVNQGVIRVNNSFSNTFNMTINSSGIRIVNTAANKTVKHISSVSLPAALLSDTSLAPNLLKNFWEIQANVSIGDLVLFTNFNDSIYNGVYKVETPIPPESIGDIRFIRASGFTNETILNNGYSINVINGSKRFILNKGMLGTSTVGVSSLLFTADSGSDVMTITSTKDVNFTASISATEKYFRIKHPDPNSKYSSLQYGSLESPYHGVRLTGKDKLKNGICEILLPDYLKHLIHEEDVSIQLTNYGHHKMLYVDKIDLKNNKFIIKGYRSKSGGPFNFYWSFTGIRKDVSILIPEQ